MQNGDKYRWLLVALAPEKGFMRETSSTLTYSDSDTYRSSHVGLSLDI